MPYPNDPAVYPDYFLPLFQRAQLEEVRVDMKERGLASNIRHQLHAFRRAAEAHRWPQSPALRNVVVTVEGTELILRPNAGLANLRAAVGASATPSDMTKDELEEYIRQAFGENSND